MGSKDEERTCPPIHYLSTTEIAYKVVGLGFIDVPGVGRLRPHTISRGALVALICFFVLILALFYALANVRIAAWQVQAVRAQHETSIARQALAECQIDQRQTVDCLFTLDSYRMALAQFEQDARQQAPTNATAASWLKLIKILEKML
jgi:hypothetical protein